MRIIQGSVNSPLGFMASGVACGQKKNGDLDLAMVASDRPATAAGVFTQNVIKGHGLQLTRQYIRGKLARAVVINSGNANACIGEDGMKDAIEMAAAAAARIDCPAEQIMIGSTGVIGQRLNMPAIKRGIDLAFAALDETATGAENAERAILTTDLVSKACAVEIDLDGCRVTVGGMAKGSGMIHPNMATMIGVITTDCAIDQPLLDQILRQAVNKTFNRVSVDGDTSVCDMVIAMANGAAGNTSIEEGSTQAAILLEAFETVSTELARMIARDGEGATKLIEVVATGAKSSEDAYKIVLAVAKSPLVKTAIFGEDANWGRILTAAGYSGADFDPEDIDIYLGDLMVCAKGCALDFDEALAKKILQEQDIVIRIVLNEGNASDRIWTCDFSYDYVKINGSYRS